MTRLAQYRALASPLLLGHRGLNTVAPENTLAAIEAAADQGADGVEIDVRMCAGGELVVFHDEDLARMTDGRDERRIASTSLQQLRTVSVQGATIPTLDAVIDLCRERQLLLNIEMKRDVPDRRAVVRATADALRDVSDDAAVVVSSFDPAMLAQLRLTASDLPTALLVAPDHRWARRLARALGVVAIHPDRTLIRAAELRQWRTRGLRVMAWTVNDIDEAKQLVALGVDGIISDDPGSLRGVI